MRLDNDFVSVVELRRVVEAREGRLEPVKNAIVGIILALGLAAHSLKQSQIVCAVLHAGDVFQHLLVGDSVVLARLDFPDLESQSHPFIIVFSVGIDLASRSCL